MKLAIVAPAPGSTPTRNPSTLDRIITQNELVNSLAVIITRPTAPMLACPARVCSTSTNTSETANRPIVTTTKSKPS